MLQNLTAVLANYRRAEIWFFVLAYLSAVRARCSPCGEALGLPLRLVRLIVQLQDIERRLVGDGTSGIRNDLREAASSIAAGKGTGVED